MDEDYSNQAPGDVLVIGGGRFGRLAVRRLGQRVRSVVEPEPTPALLAAGAPVVKGEGVAEASRMLAGSEPPAWLAPMLPQHFLARWLDLVAKPAQQLALPEVLLPECAHRMQFGPAWHLSLADFRCPDDCPEPPESCRVTGKPRGEPMYSRLARVALPGASTAVLRSHQLAPGIGALATGELMELAGRVRARRGDWVLASACRCHGVVEALRFSGQAAGVTP